MMAVSKKKKCLKLDTRVPYNPEEGEVDALMKLPEEERMMKLTELTAKHTTASVARQCNVSPGRSNCGTESWYQ